MGGFRKVGAGGLSKSWSFWGAPNLEPRWPPDPPTWSQDNLLTPQLGAKMAPGPPTWSQDGPQSSNLEPRWPPEPPTWRQDAQFGPDPQIHARWRGSPSGSWIYIYIEFDWMSVAFGSSHFGLNPFALIQLPDGEPRHRARICGSGGHLGSKLWGLSTLHEVFCFA